MMSERFDPQEWGHWLLIMAYLMLSTWILWKIYFS
jgi:hypothetical protein